MSLALRTLARTLKLDQEDRRELRTTFGLRCVERIRALIHDEDALAALEQALDDVTSGYPNGFANVDALAERVWSIARSHPGSESVDGAGHAAVSATFALANALSGKALDAADYAAYAAVYHYGSYAVNDPSAFEPEHSWQVDTLRALSGGQH